MTRILIVGTAPYDKNFQSRAFESYFHGIEPDNLAQIFTYPYHPPLGHCSKLFQITDAMMLRRFFSPKESVGISYLRENLKENDGISSEDSSDLPLKNNDYKSKVIRKLYKYGKKDRPLTYLLRGLLWKKSRWLTDDLDQWLDEFDPDCVFLSFSDDYFIPQIALYVAEKYDIPIISSIADDYYFNNRFSISPFYYIYRVTYKHLIKRILRRKRSSAIYIGERIKGIYNSTFGLNGEVLYLTSDIQRKPFKSIDKNNISIGYFGNVRLGRAESLIDIGKTLVSINPSYSIDVYSNEKDEKYVELLSNSIGINFYGSIPYNEVQDKMKKCDVIIVVEGFEKENIRTVKYSISTKIPDSLSVGAQVFAYGDKESGAIDYLLGINSSVVCTSRSELKQSFNCLINDVDQQKKYYDNATRIVERNHSLPTNQKKFSSLVNEIVKG